MLRHLKILPPIFSTLALAAAAATFVGTEISFAAPAKMLNKTVRYSFSFSAPARREDGTTVAGAGNYSRTLYVSSQGRIFDKEDRQEYREKKSFERGPEGSKFRIEGNRIVGILRHLSGATQIIVSFDGEFRTCTMNVMTGIESGKPAQMKGLNGITYTALGKVTYSNQTCSVSDGNAFGG